MTGTQPNIGIITQARMTSTRLPGKIFKIVRNKPLLEYHTDRLLLSGFPVLIATTTNKSDDCVSDFAGQHHIPVHRGSEHNVLSRFYECAETNALDIIIRVTSDCPLIDPHLIRNSVEKYMKFNNRNMYMSNAIERTFARGFDFEIFSFELLKDAYQNAKDESDLEHVTPYIWKNKSGKVEIYNVRQEQNNSDLRITVDTSEDFELIRLLLENYNADGLPYNEIEKILREHPELSALNANIEQKKL